jgi:hypothetical protein
MAISELIKSLQELQQEHGDLPVYMFDSYAEEWNTNDVSALYYHATIALDGSGDMHEFIGLG